MIQDRIPTISDIGNLKVIVRENGKNNDDGDGWSVKAEDAQKPPTQLPQGVFSAVSSFLIRR
jgi:hypothetical protein